MPKTKTFFFYSFTAAMDGRYKKTREVRVKFYELKLSSGDFEKYLSLSL